MSCRVDSRSIPWLLGLVLLTSPACRALDAISSSDTFRRDSGPSSAASSDAGADSDTPSATGHEGGTETEPDDTAAIDSDATLYVDAEASADTIVDIADHLDLDTSAFAETDAQPEADASGAADAGTLSSTAWQTATISRSSTGSQTRSNTSLPTTTVTSSRTSSQTATSTVTSTVTSVSTSTHTGSQTASASQTTTRSNTSTVTTISTPTGTESHTGSASQTASSSSSVTATGSASITLTATATALVPVISVALNKTVDQLSAQSTDQLTPRVLPPNASNQSVVWSTNNPGVATVSSSGVISAIAVGTAVITVTTVDGGKTETCAVTVVIPVAGVALSLASATVRIGETVALTATVSPANAANQGLLWSSSDTTVATVSATGPSAVVNAVGPGLATITVATLDGNKTATCIVKAAVMSAQWVQAPANSSFSATFAAVAVDKSGNIYVAGSISGTASYAFGNSVTAAGVGDSGNALLVKYDATGSAQWARTVLVGPGASAFTGVASDASGNLAAVGTIAGNGSYGFGNSVKAVAGYSFGSNLVVVSYDAGGTAKWARTIVAGMGESSYAAVTTDSAENVYAAGAISGNFPYDFGNGKSVTGSTSSGNSALLVKYAADGTTQWAQSTVNGSNASVFNAVATDNAGHFYAAGNASGTLALGLGNAVTATGTASLNALLVQYDVGGNAQWARTATSGGNNSDFKSLAVDSDASVLAAGSIDGHTGNTFDATVKVAGAYAAGSSVLLLRYDASGAAKWGQSAAHATGLSRFAGVAADQQGHLYGAGLLAGPGSYDFGNSVLAANASSKNEVLLATYDSTGMCQRALFASAASSFSGFSAVAADSTGNVYAVGYINGASAVDFGNSVSVAGSYSGGYNAVLVKYH